MTPRPAMTLMPASPCNYGSRRGERVGYLVIHTMEGSVAGTAATFADSDHGASAHYGIGKDGRLARFVCEDYAAWHAGNPDYNHRSIGIELEGSCHDPDNFTAPMMDTLVRLCEGLVRDYQIPLDRSHIVGHYQVPDPRHAGLTGGVHHHVDPGEWFPWGEIIDRLTAALAGVV